MNFFHRIFFTGTAGAMFMLLSLPTFHSALAQGTFGNFEAQLPGVRTKSIDVFVSGDRPLTRYVGFLVNIITAAIVAIGVISIVFAGFLYITDRGNSDNVSKAKSLILSALLGILLALTAWLILNTINPQITNTQI